MVNFINKIVWTILNKPYFLVRVISHGRKIKTFLQLAAGKGKGEDSFLICEQIKSAWFKPFNPIIDGLALEVTVDLNNAIPLEIAEDVVYDSNGFIIKELKEITIKENIEKQKIIKKHGNTQKFVEVSIIPTLLHEIVEAHLVKEVMATPKEDGKYDAMKWIFIIGLIVFGIVAGAYIIMG